MMIYIWGAGEKGRRIFNHLNAEDVLGFIDTDNNKNGEKYLGKETIGIQEYLNEYKDKFVLIAHSDESKGIKILQDYNIHNYFLLSDCPGELQEPNSRNNLKNYVESCLDKPDNYAIYGITLYTILIDRWIYIKTNKHPHVIPQTGLDEIFLQKFISAFPEVNVTEAEKLDSLNVHVIYNVLSDRNEDISDRVKNFTYKDLFDCSEYIAAYRNSQIERYRDKYQGKRCFIVATGPSLKSADLDCLYYNDEICFSVNGIFNLFDHTKWRPTYYVIDDYRAIQKNADKIADIALEAAFVGDSFPFDMGKAKNVHIFHKHYEYYQNRLPKFSGNFAQRSYTGLTVTYTCLQLAVYMGFSEIYLLGTDCSYNRGSENNYCYSGNGKDYFDHQVDKTLLAYQSAKEYAQEHDIKICNATRGGMLEVFERVDFDTLFKEQEKK